MDRPIQDVRYGDVFKLDGQTYQKRHMNHEPTAHNVATNCVEFLGSNARVTILTRAEWSAVQRYETGLQVTYR